MVEMIAAVVVVGLIISWIDRKLREQPIESIGRVAVELGLELDAPERCARGMVGGVRVEVLTGERLVVRVTPERPGLAPRIRSAAKASPTSYQEVYWQVAIDGDHAAVVAGFDRGARAALLELVRAGGTIEYDVIAYESAKVPDSGEIVTRVSQLIAVGNALLLPPEDVPERLSRRALEDPSVPIRRYALQLLTSRFPRHSEGTLKAALRDPSPQVRLEAARLLGDDGFRELERLVGTPQVGGVVRASALRHLLGHLPAERLSRFLLREVGNKRADSALALIAAPELGRLGDATFEVALLPLLEHPSTDVRIAAAMALEQVGTRAAIDALSDVAYSANLIDRHLRAAAKKALDAIEERCSSHKRGLLSIAEPAPEAGAVSVAEGGRVTLAEEE